MGALAALAGACLAGVPGTAPAQPPPEWFAVNSSELWIADAPGRGDAILDRQRATGLGAVRQVFWWSEMEPAPGRFELARSDAFVGRAARHGIEVMPVLLHPPPFRSSAPAGGAGPAAYSGAYPPADPADMGRFAATLARRYGARGSFWREHPDLPPRPVRAWQVWNEPNLPAYWGGAPDPAAYAQLLRATARAVRDVDPGAEIVTAGIPEPRSRGAIGFGAFVAGMLGAGAGADFDTLAVHPYGVDDQAAVELVERARALLDARGVRAALRATEWGWAGGGPASSFTAGEEGQATMVECALRKLADRRAALDLRGVSYYEWRDTRPWEGRPDYWGLHTGLLTADDRPKPAHAAFRDTARRLRGAADPGTPTACFTHAPRSLHAGDPVTLSSTSLDPGGAVTGAEWDLDGDGAFDDAAGATVAHAFPLPGAHTVRLRVTDADGGSDVATRSLTVRSRRPSASFAVTPEAPVAGAAVAFTSTGADAFGPAPAAAGGRRSPP